MVLVPVLCCGSALAVGFLGRQICSWTEFVHFIRFSPLVPPTILSLTNKVVDAVICAGHKYFGSLPNYIRPNNGGFTTIRIENYYYWKDQLDIMTFSSRK
jgi:hypothetical protein